MELFNKSTKQNKIIFRLDIPLPASHLRDRSPMIFRQQSYRMGDGYKV